MKKIAGLLMIATLFLTSCNTNSDESTTIDQPVISQEATTPEDNTPKDDMELKVGSSYSEGKEEIDFKPIDVYIFIDGNEKQPIENAKITATREGQEEQSFKTNKEGIASFKFKLGTVYNFNIEAEKYAHLKQDVMVKEKLSFGLKPRGK